MERYLIINADDYGMCHAANAAVEHLFNEGCLSTTTLMTPCPWAEDGVRRAKANPAMKVGLHLTTNCEWQAYRWGPRATVPVPSLLDASGYFPRKVEELLQKATANDIEVEIKAQLDFMLSRDLRPTHIDNHMGSLYGIHGPSYMAQVFALCKQGNWAFRLPRSAKAFGKMPEALEGQLEFLVAQADQWGIGTLDHLCSHPFPVKTEDGYESLKTYYLDLIRNLKPGITEMFLHPAKDSEELRAICPDWQKRAWEYRFLLEPGLRQFIADNGILLTDWTRAPFFPRA